jgi:hypothetical protein
MGYPLVHHHHNPDCVCVCACTLIERERERERERNAYLLYFNPIEQILESEAQIGWGRNGGCIAYSTFEIN